MPFDETEDFDEGLRAELRDLFNRPNPSVESFRSWVEPILEDLLVLDAGVIEKERTLGGGIAALHSVDGGKIKVSTMWDGDPDETRYWWVPTPQYEVPFRNEDLVYIMANPRTYYVLGLTPLETLKMTIDAEVAGSTYNARQVDQRRARRDARPRRGSSAREGRGVQELLAVRGRRQGRHGVHRRHQGRQVRPVPRLQPRDAVPGVADLPGPQDLRRLRHQPTGPGADVRRQQGDQSRPRWR